MAAKRDCWADWVTRMRPGPESENSDHPHWRWRDRVLDAAEPIVSQTILDVGCGEGLLGFGALGRGAQEVIFVDVSEKLLEFCRAEAERRESLDRCRFILASAEHLTPVALASVVVVTTRSVLIYVDDKEAAFREFARVLRPGGRLSVFEPINRFAQRATEAWMGYDLAPISRLATKVRSVYEAIQPPDSDPMLNFDERDLLALADLAGFSPIDLRLEAEIRPTEPQSWERFASTAGNPRIPTLADAMSRSLTDEEAATFIAHLRPLVEEGRGQWRMATAHLRAVMPPD